MLLMALKPYCGVDAASMVDGNANITIVAVHTSNIVSKLAISYIYIYIVQFINVDSTYQRPILNGVVRRSAYCQRRERAGQ